MLFDEIASAVATATEGTEGTAGTFNNMNQFMSGFTVIIGLDRVVCGVYGQGIRV